MRSDAARGPRGGRAARLLAALSIVAAAGTIGSAQIGREVAMARHLAEGEEFTISRRDLLDHGQRLFAANWIVEAGWASCGPDTTSESLG